MVTEWMTPKRRFISALFGGRVDRIPAANAVSSVTMELMDQTKTYFPHAHIDPHKMAQLAGAVHDILGFDAIMPVYSVHQEAAALGANVDWGAPDMMPSLKSVPWKGCQEIILPSDYLKQPALQVVLEAIRILRVKYPHVAIIGKVMGPWSLSYHMLGVEDFLIQTITEPEKVEHYLDVFKEVTLEFGRAQIQAGADVICLADHATGDLVSPLAYEKYLMPIHKELNMKLGAPTILHICGDTKDRLRFIVEAKFDSFHFDSKVDAQEAKTITQRKEISLIGNLDNIQTLLQGTPADVRREVGILAAAGIEIIGPECAVPLQTPIENLKAITQACREMTYS